MACGDRMACAGLLACADMPCADVMACVGLVASGPHSASLFSAPASGARGAPKRRASITGRTWVAPERLPRGPSGTQRRLTSAPAPPRHRAIGTPAARVGCPSGAQAAHKDCPSGARTVRLRRACAAAASQRCVHDARATREQRASACARLMAAGSGVDVRVEARRPRAAAGEAAVEAQRRRLHSRIDTSRRMHVHSVRTSAKPLGKVAPAGGLAALSAAAHRGPRRRSYSLGMSEG